ncbi:hypothetical protein TWF281_006189 [Arthrobotrys megalospora]
MIRDGSLILGGYNSGVLGPGVEFTEFSMVKPADKSCPFSIEIAGVTWFGRNASISTNEQSFTACVNPGSNLLEFPPDIWRQLKGFHEEFGNRKVPAEPPGTAEDLIPDFLPGDNINKQPSPNPIIPVYQQGLVSNFGYPQHIPKNFDSFTMTIQIKNGPSIVIPGHQIIQRPRKINSDGIIDVPKFRPFDEDITRISVVTPSKQNGNIDPVFGLPFLAAAYFMVNHENSTFGLAPIPTDISNITALVPINHPSCYPELQPESKRSAKIIAPAAVGSIATMAIIIIGVYLLWRRYAGSKYGQSEIPLEALGPEKDGTERFEAGGSEVVHMSDSTEIYQKDSNAIYQLPDDCGTSATNRSRSTRSARSIYELA